MTHPGRTEHGEQSAVIDWANVHVPRWPELKWLFAIPNWRIKPGQRIYLAEEGVKKGVADLCLPAGHGGYFGWYCEMKLAPNKPTLEQKLFLKFVKAQGYYACVAYGYDEAITYLEEYLIKPATQLRNKACLISQ